MICALAQISTHNRKMKKSSEMPTGQKRPEIGDGRRAPALINNANDTCT
jgi:hypothetical protein